MRHRINWIIHNGKKILFNDYQDLKGNELLEYLNQSEQEVLNSGLKSVLVINDVTNSFMNKESTSQAKKWISNCKEKGVIMTIALIGVTGIKKLVAQNINRDMYFAKDIDDAKEWLVSH